MVSIQRTSRRGSDPRRIAWVLATVIAATSITLGGRAAPKKGAAPAASASASSAAPTAADLKAQGDKAFDAFLYSDALRHYEAAYEISPDPALLFNRGRALQALGRYPEALTMFERFDTDAPPALRAKVPGLPKLIAEVRARVAVLRVRCNVPDAQVIVSDRVLGEAGSLGDVRLNAGAVTVRVQREGYFPVKRDVQLVGGDTATVEVSLLSKATSGVLAVAVQPSAARVSIDGKPVGNAPIELVLPAGTHDIDVTSPGYEPLRSKAVVKPDARADVRLTMRAIPPITARWWFWAGVGAVVVTGVAIGLALTTDREAPSGDFSPPRVSAPLVSF